MPRLGYRASSRAQGVGEMAGDTTRGSILGSFQQATWVTSISWWGGRSGASNGSAGPAVYAVSSGELTDELWYGGPQTVTAYMSPSDPTTGVLMTRPVTGLLLAAGRTVAGAVVNEGAASIAYGQDNSGHLMHYSDDAPTDPFNYRATNPILAQGKMHVSLEGVTNRAPNQPTITSPVANAQTVDTTPTITFTFSDPDEDYGDYINAYRVEVYNETGTTRLHDSGWDATTGTEQSTGTASYTLPTITAGQMVRVVVTVRDRAALASTPAEVQFSVVTAGAYTVDGISDVAGQNSDGIDVVTTTTPAVTMTWNHDSALDADTTDVRIVEVDTGSVYRGPYTWTINVPDTTQVVDWGFTTPDPDWAAMATGATVYRYEVRGTDTNGGLSDWAPSQPFVVNSAPVVGIKSPSDAVTVSTVPTFRARLTDATDGSATLQNIEFEIEHVSSTNTITIDGVYDASGVLLNWRESHSVTQQLIKAGFFLSNGYGDYRWRVLGEDPWGEELTDAWRTFTYAEPPDVTVTNPTDESTIDTGTPTITATIDRTLDLYRVTITRDDLATVVYDSGEVENATSAISHDVPGGVLPNNLDYTLSIWVRTADTLENTVETAFRLEYTPPAALTNVAITPVRSSDFDRAQPSISEQTPNVDITWDAVDSGDVSDEDWLHYVIYRISGDGRNRQWIIEDRDQTTFTDTTPAALTNHTYYVGYEQVINSGIDTIESVLTKATVTVEIHYTTITSENPDDPAVALHYWEDREVEPVVDMELVPVFGEEKPIAFQGSTDYDVLSGEFLTIDDRSGNRWYTARDVVNAVRDLKALEPLDTIERIINIISGATGNARIYGPRPRSLVWRDPRGRVVHGVISRGPRERDAHRLDRARFDLEFTEIARPVSGIIAVNDADAVEIGGGA